MTSQLTRPGLDDLVEELRCCLGPAGSAHDSAQAVAARLWACPPSTSLLSATELAGRDGRPASTVLHAEPDFSVVALVWRPGQHTAIHDHVSWCVVAVLAGTEVETVYRLEGDRLVAEGETRNEDGSVTALLPPGDIHRVSNTGDRVAVSLHVYGADLGPAGTSLRRTYDVDERTLAVRSIR